MGTIESQWPASNGALFVLAKAPPSHAPAVELRFTLGLTFEEASAASNVPESAVNRRWQARRTWLLDLLRNDDADRP